MACRERVVVLKYALKPACIPTLAILGMGVGELLGGAVFAEVIFNRPGFGSLIYDAIQTRNYPVLQGGVLVIVMLFVLTNLLVDLSYAWIDPRVRARLASGGGAQRMTWRRLLSELMATRAGAFGLIAVALLLIVAIFAPLLASHDPNAIAPINRLQGPSARAFLRHRPARPRSLQPDRLWHAHRHQRGGRGPRRSRSPSASCSA